MAFYLAQMVFVYLICYLQMTTLFSTKLQWKRANASLKFLGGMKRRRGRQSIYRRPLSSLAGTQAKLLKQISKAFFGALIMEDCESYLGLPMVGGKSKVNTFKDLQERITKKIGRAHV